MSIIIDIYILDKVEGLTMMELIIIIHPNLQFRLKKSFGMKRKIYSCYLKIDEKMIVVLELLIKKIVHLTLKNKRKN